MPQLFHRSTNTISRVTIFGAVFILAGAGTLMGLVYRSPYVTNQNIAHVQPVQFSHEHHVSGLGLDCRYCHFSVEDSSFAGIPPTKVCMNCHRQIWADSPYLAPVRDSFKNDESIQWTRVHNLPDHVYFNHSIHVAKGIGCNECHGRVDKMNLMWQDKSLMMKWCIECHREPEKFVRPKDEVFNMQYEHPKNQVAMGKELVAKYHIANNRITCSTCHR